MLCWQGRKTLLNPIHSTGLLLQDSHLLYTVKHKWLAIMPNIQRCTLPCHVQEVVLH